MHLHLHVILFVSLFLCSNCRRKCLHNIIQEKSEQGDLYTVIPFPMTYTKKKGKTREPSKCDHYLPTA